MEKIAVGRLCSLTVAALLLGLFLAAGLGAQEADKRLVARGQYLISIAGGCGCHTVPKGTPYAGGREIAIPFGKVYSTNITQDKETGIGGWTDRQIRAALLKGVRRSGRRLLPVMPYEAYSGMAEEDIKALIAYLRTLQPVRKKNLRPKLWLPFYRSALTPLWLKFFGHFSSAPAEAPKSGIERGRYLVDHVSLCADCHTPRTIIGVPYQALYLAGMKVGPFGQEIPNITPDKETGIGKWSREEIAELLHTGNTPDGDNVQGLMAEVVEAGFKNMKREDALAIADYLRSAAPIKNKTD